jgi:hypothetical protein
VDEELRVFLDVLLPIILIPLDSVSKYIEVLEGFPSPRRRGSLLDQLHAD